MGSEEGLWTENWHTGEKWKKKKGKQSKQARKCDKTKKWRG